MELVIASAFLLFVCLIKFAEVLGSAVTENKIAKPFSGSTYQYLFLIISILAHSDNGLKNQLSRSSIWDIFIGELCPSLSLHPLQTRSWYLFSLFFSHFLFSELTLFDLLFLVFLLNFLRDFFVFSGSIFTLLIVASSFLARSLIMGSLLFLLSCFSASSFALFS